VKRTTIFAALAITIPLSAAHAGQRLLDETVQFAGAVLFASTHVPGMIIGAVRDGETATIGFGRRNDQSGEAPDGDTMLRIGSITKTFTGSVLAHLVAAGTVDFTDDLSDHLRWDVDMPSRDGKGIRLIDLVTHTSGLPREISAAPGPADDPYRNHTKAAYVASLRSDPLLFAPATGALYSNFAYNLLSSALAEAAGRPFPDLVNDLVLKPRRLASTTYWPNVEQRADLMQGHDIDGSPLPDIVSTPGTFGSGGLYSSANDILKWLEWHLDRFGREDAEVRLLDHAAYVQRDGLDPVYGMDESGHMTRSGSAGSSWSLRATVRSFCRRLAACRACSAMSPSPRPAASACSLRSTSTTSTQPEP
jgi:D-alanyl-D-alanine-carboxypeptidase/D-alanyl-D-alanine-endopeptidase